MRIILISPYFMPDTPPYATMIDAIARRLARDGHDIAVLTCQPSYNRSAARRAPAREMLSPNIEVRRRRTFSEGRRLGLGRFLNVVLFCWSVVTARRWTKRVDVVMAVSTPPIVLGISGRFLAQLCRADFIYHKQDIHPDAAAAIGLGRSRYSIELLRHLDSWTDRRAARVVVLSGDMAATETARGVLASRLCVINNFDPWETPARVERGSAASDEAGPFRVIFAGNLGRFQGLHSLLCAAMALRGDDRIRFDLVGDGALRAELEREIAAQRLQNVTFHGYVPPPEAAALLRDSSVGVVSLAPGVIRTAYPSKTMSYLRNGCPVIAMVEADSDLAYDLQDAGAGIAVPPGDWRSLVDSVRKLCSDPASLESMRAAATALYEKAFAKESRLEDWATLANELAVGRVR